MYKHSTNVHKEKERFSLIDCFDLYSKSAEKLKKMPIELNKFILGGPLFSNHPVWRAQYFLKCMSYISSI